MENAQINEQRQTHNDRTDLKHDDRKMPQLHILLFSTSMFLRFLSLKIKEEMSIQETRSCENRNRGTTVMTRKCSCGEKLTPIFHEDALAGWYCKKCKKGVTFKSWIVHASPKKLFAKSFSKNGDYNHELPRSLLPKSNVQTVTQKKEKEKWFNHLKNPS